MAQDVRTMIARFYDEINAGNLAVIDELIADDFVEREELPRMTR